MGQNTVEYILQNGGTILRRESYDRVVTVDEAFLDRIQGRMASVSIRNLAVIEEWGTINAKFTSGEYHTLTIPVTRLLLRLKWTPIEGVWVPRFDASKDELLEMKWVVPEGMKMIMHMIIRQTYSGGRMQYSVPQAFLYAVDSRPEYWRLPLPNIFEDGRVCEGRRVLWFTSIFQAVIDMLTTFDKSQWNSDLCPDMEKCQSLFRFQPDEKGFVQQPALKSWITLCNKVVSSAIQSNIIL